jgi:hypothetical protein
MLESELVMIEESKGRRVIKGEGRGVVVAVTE